MENAGQPLQGMGPAGGLSCLSKAGLRNNERLDVDTALRAAMEGHLALGLDANVVELMWQALGAQGPLGT